MKHRCFTLIELLVVIAVVAILLAILIPVLHSIRQRAKALACSSRIRKLTLDLIMYETKNQAFPYGFRDSFTPPPGGYLGSTAYDRLGLWWFHGMEGYNDDTQRRILLCPSKLLRHPSLTRNLLYGNYGVNRSICKSPDDTRTRREEFVGAPLGRSDIPQPSRTLLIVDSGYSIISWWHATDVPPVPLDGKQGEDVAYVPGLKINKDKNLLPGQEQDAIDGRHPNKTVNVGFADGHVARKKADDLFVEKAEDVYTNRIPLWLPE
jgi:prepilin-type processing-associated H-X9-DG protein/prepilin-type N-terminal cleavage/methylation domain-containing protein